MPDHFHGIIVINEPNVSNDARIFVGAGPCARPHPVDSHARPHPVDCHVRPQLEKQSRGMEGQPQGVAPTCLSMMDVVGRFKSLTTKKYIDHVKHHNWSPFHGKLWQRNYYEHIIRDDVDLYFVREYINNNPAKQSS
ncbi:MAG: transposase [Bacillota bacterium]